MHWITSIQVNWLLVVQYHLTVLIVKCGILLIIHGRSQGLVMKIIINFVLPTSLCYTFLDCLMTLKTQYIPRRVNHLLTFLSTVKIIKSSYQSWNLFFKIICYLNICNVCLYTSFVDKYKHFRTVRHVNNII